MAANTGQSAPDDRWIASLQEEVLEPELPIIDPHHHLWLRNGYTYLLPELAADLACGHNIVATVFAECHSMYRQDGIEEQRSLGETEFVRGQAAMSASGEFGSARACDVMFGNVDLTLGSAAEPLLEQHIEASGGRFRGVRLSTGWHADERPPPGPSLKEQNEIYQRLLAAAMAPPRSEEPSLSTWKKDDEARHRLIVDYTDFFKGWDVMLAPIAPTAAFTHRTEQALQDRTLTVDNEEIAYAKHLVWAGLATLPGLPATAVPLARSQNGLPIGMQIIGPKWADRTTLAVASLVEALTGGFVAPPGY